MFGEPKGRYCSLCNSSHCPQANMDYTIGCCICFSIAEIERGINPISLCDICEELERELELELELEGDDE